MRGWNGKLDFTSMPLQTMENALRILMHESVINLVTDILDAGNSFEHQTFVQQQI